MTTVWTSCGRPWIAAVFKARCAWVIWMQRGCGWPMPRPACRHVRTRHGSSGSRRPPNETAPRWWVWSSSLLAILTWRPQIALRPSTSQELVFHNLSLIRESLARLNQNILPHEVKSLRKEIGTSRYYLDLFIYAYPCIGNKDLLKNLRKHLDEGYTIFGNFKTILNFNK